MLLRSLGILVAPPPRYIQCTLRLRLLLSAQLNKPLRCVILDLPLPHGGCQSLLRGHILSADLLNFLLLS